MNSLSWFLYFAELFHVLKVAASVVFIVTATIGALALVTDNKEDDWLLHKWIRRRLMATLIAFGVPALFIPSQQTMYAIAASEVGEKIVKSEQVQGIASDATKALHQWIKRQIEPESKK